MKKILKSFTVGLSVVMGMGFAVACNPESNPPQAQASSYVGIDVNPSLSLVLDQENKVLSVVAENEDAQVLLYEESIVGLDVNKAIEKIADLSVELGYLNESNYGVNVTVEGNANEAQIQASVEASFEKAAENENFTLNFTADGNFSTLRELKAVNEEFNLNLTLGEFELIANAQSVDPTLTVSMAAELSTEDLLKIIEEKSAEIKPYATSAYEHAKATAIYVYQNAKASLIDKLWAIPYVNVLKYPNMTGILYNLYSDSARSLAMALDGVELIIETKENTEVSQSVIDGIALKLELDETEKQAYLAKITVDGKVTVASLEGYLNSYFKNLNATQKQELQATMDEIMADVQAVVNEIERAIDAEIEKEFGEITTDMEGFVPETLQSLGASYLTEFNKVMTEIQESTEGKEPLEVAYSALEKLEEKKATAYATMREELKEEDLASVESNVQRVNEQLLALEKTLNDAITKAENEAKAYFSNLKQARLANNQ